MIFYILCAFTALIFGLINSLRGANYVPRIVAALACGGTFMGYLGYADNSWLAASIAGLICAAGIFAGLLPGWGRGFAAFHGRLSRNEVEIQWLDDLADKFFPFAYQDVAAARRWGVFWMTVRGSFFYPAFIGVALYLGQYWLLLTGLAVLSMGSVYGLMRFAPEKHAVRLAEFLYLSILGAALAAGCVHGS